MRLKVALVLLSALTAAPASAQWMSAESDNPFADNQRQWVFTMAAPAYAFGFICEGNDPDDAGLVFITPETGESSTVAFMNATKPQLAVIIDNGERTEFAADLDMIDLDGKEKLRATAKGADAVAFTEKIGAAKRRVSVALIALGKPFHATNFGVAGSRKKIEAAVKACGIAPADGADAEEPGAAARFLQRKVQ